MSTFEQTAPEPVYQVTHWGDPNELMETSFGRISYHHWCSAECDRWKDKWRSAWVVEHPGNPEQGIPDGAIAIFTYLRYAQLTLKETEE